MAADILPPPCTGLEKLRDLISMARPLLQPGRARRGASPAAAGAKRRHTATALGAAAHSAPAAQMDEEAQPSVGRPLASPFGLACDAAGVRAKGSSSLGHDDDDDVEEDQPCISRSRAGSVAVFDGRP
eukprot:SRR837773.10480.p3 GENE.SRR837773.10480~~SRR837773.10480.p3  ORF type:complete len:143 (-),score=35.84 SRR837773.10480:50-433(-)